MTSVAVDFFRLLPAQSVTQVRPVELRMGYFGIEKPKVLQKVHVVPLGPLEHDVEVKFQYSSLLERPTTYLQGTTPMAAT